MSQNLTKRTCLSIPPYMHPQNVFRSIKVLWTIHSVSKKISLFTKSQMLKIIHISLFTTDWLIQFLEKYNILSNHYNNLGGHSRASHLEIQSSWLFMYACGELGYGARLRINLGDVYKGGGRSPRPPAAVGWLHRAG